MGGGRFVSDAYERWPIITIMVTLVIRQAPINFKISTFEIVSLHEVSLSLRLRSDHTKTFWKMANAASLLNTKHFGK